MINIMHILDHRKGIHSHWGNADFSPGVVFSRKHHKRIWPSQGGITCGAIDEPRKSSKAIDEQVIINFRDKNVVITRFRDKNVVIARFLIYR